MTFITWNNFDLKTIVKAEAKKKECENKGMILIHQSSNSLTYKN